MAAMTIAALRALIDEELPGIPRHPAPRIPHLTRKAPPMDQQPVPSAPGLTMPMPDSSAGPAPISVGQLLKWAAEQPDKATRQHEARARASLDELRARHRAWQMLAIVDAEEAKLLERLAAVRTRRDQLRPKRARAAASYDAAAVRAWARAHGVPVPAVGRIPAPVLAAWRAATGGAQ